MSEQRKIPVGSIGWADLTIKNAVEVRDFYKEVIGWQVEELSMGDYSDFCMLEPGESKPVAGVCHARGANAALPPVWMIYITVSDLEKSVTKCVELGGEILAEPRNSAGYGHYCVIRDPAGAVAALFEPKE